MTMSESPVDLSRPLLPQVAALGDRYDAWVHRSIRPQRSLRIFRSDFLEAFSHIPWWLVLGIWAPVAIALWAGAVWGLGLSVGHALLLALAGAFGWTLFEYLLHRFVFHHKPRRAWSRQLHFLAHGIHHLDPWDPTRLVFPPLPGALLAGLVFLGLWAFLPLAAAMAVMGGFLAGYLTYDMTHYYTHHARPRTRWGKFVKRYHLAHHHQQWDRMFGVSQPLWDVVFRTGPEAGLERAQGTGTERQG